MYDDILVFHCTAIRLFKERREFFVTIVGDPL